MRNCSVVLALLASISILIISGSTSIAQTTPSRSGAGSLTRIDPAIAHFRAALSDAQAGRTQAAIQEYQQGLQTMPNDMPGRFNLGLLLAQVGRSEEAETEFKQVAQSSISPPYLRLASHLRIGMIAESLGKFDEAESQYHLILESQPSNPDALIALGSLNLRRGNTDGAIHYFEAYQKVVPTNAMVRFNLGILYARKKQLVEALHEFQAATKLPGALPRVQRIAAMINCGIIYDNLPGHIVDAIAAYRKLLVIDPRNSTAWSSLGTDQQKLHQYQDASTSYNKALAIKPSLTFTRFNLGVVLINMAKYSEAAVAFEQVLKENPKNSGARSNLALALISANGPDWADRLARAKTLYLQAEKDDPKNPSNYAGLAYAYSMSNPPDLARSAEQYAKLSDLRPNDFDTVQRLASLYGQMKKYDLAVSSLQQWLNKQPKTHEPNPDAYLAISGYQNQSGKYDAAVATLRDFLAIQHDNDRVRLALAGLFANAKPKADTQGSIGEYQKVLKHTPNSIPAMKGLATQLQPTNPKEAATYLERAFSLALLAKPSTAEDVYGEIGAQLVGVYQQLKQPNDVTRIDRTMLDRAITESKAAHASPLAQFWVTSYRLQLAKQLMSQPNPDYDGAANLYKAAFAAQPKDPEYISLAGDAYAAEKQYKNALDCYRSAINLGSPNPKDVNSYMQMALIQHSDVWLQSDASKLLVTHANDTDALATFRIFADAAKAHQLKPEWVVGLFQSVANAVTTSPVALASLADAQNQAGSWQDALVNYQKSLVLNPKDPQALASKANLEAQHGRLDDGITDMQAAVQLDPANPLYQQQVLQLLQRRPGGKPAEIASLQGLLDKVPSAGLLANELSHLYTDPNQNQERITLYQKLLNQAPTAEYHVALADAYEKAGENVAAKAQYLLALKMDPSNLSAREGIVRLTPKPLSAPPASTAPQTHPTTSTPGNTSNSEPGRASSTPTANK